VPWGLYNVTAEKEGHVYYAVFALGPNSATGVTGFTGEIGTATHNIAIPDYAYIPPINPSITPTPTLSFSSTPIPVTPTPTPTAKASPGFEAPLALMVLLGLAYMVAKKEN
jgi:hypothetical protein